MAISESDVVGMFAQEYSWEQILYRIIAQEGMDPWDINLAQLSDRFVQSIERARTLDFKVPAKYIILAAVLLRMKAEHLDVVQAILNEPPAAEALPANGSPVLSPLLGPLAIPPNRQPLRRVMVEELIEALRKALKTSERRELREVRAREKIDIQPENLGARIAALYGRITSLLGTLKREEIPFSQLVGQWSRSRVLDTFIPLVYLDHNRQVETRQEEPFKEIFVRATQNGVPVSGSQEKQDKHK